VVEALGLGESRGQIERAAEPELRRNIGEQVVDRAHADFLEHRSPVGVRG
jgi:hypothetical protein